MERTDSSFMEEEGEDLRKKYEEAIEALDEGHHHAAQLLQDNVGKRLAKTKWMIALGDAGSQAVSDIRETIISEQKNASVDEMRQMARLRETVDDFSDGMTKHLRAVQGFSKDQSKDAMRVQRAASSKEVDNALAKQGYDLKQEMKEMEDRYEAELARLRAQMATEREQFESEIEGLKLALRKKGEEVKEWQARYDNLEAEFNAMTVELEKLQELTKHQAQKIEELREELLALQGLRDDYDAMMRNINGKIEEILVEVRSLLTRSQTSCPPQVTLQTHSEWLIVSSVSCASGSDGGADDRRRGAAGQNRDGAARRLPKSNSLQGSARRHRLASRGEGGPPVRPIIALCFARNLARSFACSPLP